MFAFTKTCHQIILRHLYNHVPSCFNDNNPPKMADQPAEISYVKLNSIKLFEKCYNLFLYNIFHCMEGIN